MKQLILDETKKKRKKRKNTSSTKFVRGPWFGFFPDWEKDREIFNQNTEYNKPVEGKPASDTPIEPGDITGGESSSDGSGDTSTMSASSVTVGDGGMNASAGDGGSAGGDGGSMGAGAGGI